MARCLLPEAWPRREGRHPPRWALEAEEALAARLARESGRRFFVAPAELAAAPDRFARRTVALFDAPEQVGSGGGAGAGADDLSRRLMREGRVLASLLAGPAARDFHGRRPGKAAKAALNTQARLFTGDRAAEARARGGKAGLWGEGFAPLQAEAAGEYTARWRGFAVLQGRAVSWEEGGSYGWLRFGERRTGCTLAVADGLFPSLEALGRDPAGLVGQALELRGWLEWRGGPYVALAGPHRLSPPMDAPG